MSKILDAKIPGGPIADKWDRHEMECGLVAPANRRKFTVLVVGTGLAGGGAAAALGELGYNVLNFCINDTPRRAHSVAAQGGINAAKNYQNDGDSVERLFYDTVKGGDYRAREANVYRLSQLSVDIIDHCAALGVPFAREYGGTLANRSFGGVQVSRTFYARGQTGQQLLLGVYSALSRQVDAGTVKMFPRHEMLDLVVVDGRARGIICRDLTTGELKRYMGDAVVLATGGYSPVFYLSTNAVNCNATAAWRSHRRGAFFANPCYTQIHPTAIPQMGDYQSKLTLMSESLRNDGRVWVPKKAGDKRRPSEIPENERDYYLERRYPAFGNLVPRDIAARAAKVECDAGKSAYMSPYSVYLDFGEAIGRLGRDVVADRYGNLFSMYHEILDDDPYETPMMIYPAPHYTMGGLWVDYNLQSTIEGLFVAGEANFSDHGANRLGASALMQGCADGYFVVPRVVANYLAQGGLGSVSTDHDAFGAAEADVRSRYDSLLKIKGKRTVREFHWELGRVMWDKVGMARSKAGLEEAIAAIGRLREEFYQDVTVPGDGDDFNKQLEMAGRVADFLELGELMARDALRREESCGGHFREEHQTPEGEARRDDENFMHVAAWEFQGDGKVAVAHEEPLTYENIQVKTRSYK
ncbi:MAG TPA: fumarate reductase/succinate dehydrogenase flavoprotein subunit [Candidatus Krumholzibacteria bacterium]|nr:fumarate reductase/succinate dehydrogenase flavoprotein subunit [Candidatus Krumholzibacteria bacterium]HRX51597.1 fumarate reductase/succinate dehydrogenase flavoprotein subunit [Candidatus Krumholzibacteria bacterium]